MEIGNTVKTTKEIHVTERCKPVVIPKGTVGLVCEVFNNDVALVEIWGEDAPEGLFGVYSISVKDLSVIR